MAPIESGHCHVLFKLHLPSVWLDLNLVLATRQLWLWAHFKSFHDSVSSPLKWGSLCLSHGVDSKTVLRDLTRAGIIQFQWAWTKSCFQPGMVRSAGLSSPEMNPSPAFLTDLHISKVGSPGPQHCFLWQASLSQNSSVGVSHLFYLPGWFQV